MTVREKMPIQVGGELDLARRRNERGVVIVSSIPWPMISDEASERQSQKNHGQTVERIAERGGYSACEAICVMSSMDYQKLGKTEGDAHKILYAMVCLFNRGKHIGEEKAFEKLKQTSPPEKATDAPSDS